MLPLLSAYHPTIARSYTKGKTTPPESSFAFYYFANYILLCEEAVSAMGFVGVGDSVNITNVMDRLQRPEHGGFGGFNLLPC